MSSALLDVLEIRLARLDARIKQSPGQLSLLGPGTGQPCGEGYISKAKKCRKGAGQPSKSPRKRPSKSPRKVPEAAPPATGSSPGAAPAGRHVIALDRDQPTFGGLKATRSLGSGAFGTTYQFDTDDGPVVVKVNGLKMGDPGEGNPSVTLDQQRENVARREYRNLHRAHDAGVGPEPLGELTHLPDGRWSLAYRMLPGMKLTPSHRTLELTPEAQQTLATPEFRANYVKGAIQLARRQADAGLIHGDLHGGNILVGPDGTPTLIDWAQTREARTASSPDGHSAAGRAADEAYALIPLLNYAGQVKELQEAGKGASTLAASYLERAREAQDAYRAVISAHDLDWEDQRMTAEEAEPDKKASNQRILQAMTLANRLVKEEGLSYAMAERDPRVGLEAPLTPEVLARAAAARDAIFGQTDLEDMRREFDRRFGGQA